MSVLERRRTGAPEAGELAWLALVPCAALTIALVVLLGPPLGNALERGDVVFWPAVPFAPEPVEHGRYLLALLGPLLVSAVVLTGGRWWHARPSPTTVRIAAATAQLVVLGVVVGGLLAQNNVGWTAELVRPSFIARPAYLAVAAGLTATVFAAMRRPRIAVRVARAARHETRALRIACTALAVGLAATWLSSAVNTDRTLVDMLGVNLLPWTMNETYAVLDGRTPLVDFHATYAQLWPYVAAGLMALLDRTTALEWTLTMTSTSGLALLAVYAVLRRVVRSSASALLLFAPVLAIGFLASIEQDAHRFSTAGIFSLWPLRFAGPYLLAWLTARHVDGVAPRHLWLVLSAGGLVAINNPEFGISALVGALAAILCARPPASWRALGQLLATAAGGVLTAMALVSLLALARTGRLPDFALLFEFSRLFGVGGWLLETMPSMGLHMIMYATFAAALVLAVVRAKRGDADVVLTAMLAWIGVFGLLGGSYYVGRSNPLGVMSLLSPWALALALLLVATVRDLSARAWRRPAPLQVAVVFAFAFAACSVTQIPNPLAQLERLDAPGAEPPFATRDVERFVDGMTRPGERVALLAPLGHRIAYDLGLQNVAPYSSVESLPTPRQVEDTIAVLRREGVRHVFLGMYDLTAGSYLEEVVAAFESAGYERRGEAPNVQAMVDSRPRPEAVGD